MMHPSFACSGRRRETVERLERTEGKMETELIELDDSAILKLKGRLDTKTSKEVTEVFQKAGEKYDRVVLELGEMNYISSAGIRAIRNLYMILYKKGGELTVAHPGENVMQVFEMTGLSSLFHLN